jgi:hypothetical protein
VIVPCCASSDCVRIFFRLLTAPNSYGCFLDNSDDISQFKLPVSLCCGECQFRDLKKI